MPNCLTTRRHAVVGASTGSDETHPGFACEGVGFGHRACPHDHPHAVVAIQVCGAWRDPREGESRLRIHQPQPKPLGVDRDSADAVAIQATRAALNSWSAFAATYRVPGLIDIVVSIYSIITS